MPSGRLSFRLKSTPDLVASAGGRSFAVLLLYGGAPTPGEPPFQFRDSALCHSDCQYARSVA
jgi:hypothetical protein